MEVSPNIPVKISFHGQEADAKVFIASTFTKPAWELLEMEANTLDGSDAYFTKTFHPKQGKDYYYRFRIGRDGEWTVDESKPIGADDNGHRVNIFNAIPGEPVNTLGEAGATQDNHSKAPLFAHECLGAYEITDEDLDDEPIEKTVPRKTQPMVPNADNVDVNDPTLEEFPCDRDAIMGTLRKIQSSTDVAIMDDGTGRASMDSSNGNSPPSSSLSPASNRRRGNSYGSQTSEKPLTALNSISE
ncbi:hypothetical protein VHEMI05153 [[Torrubiella] hemipterigena]|uniref:AMP-activated protein kinase glycogen-binding domain-containing protein n=1 Tax=[Torrubiella] hemipterigena TaxID=1531966 RepID=A0A0A1TGC8_9HYPO|nr:hypothetical protein VHEMI05153 [[Torrubiella] hemipterigena]